ncbi:hypothetical protein KC573_03640, partial [candidate division WWE3 bacterium]|nr:hypothetical protein [candidate division WWE3 bacterium]
MKQKLRSVVLSRWFQVISSIVMGLLYGSYVFIFSRMVGAVNSVACILQPVCDNEFPLVLVQRCDCNTLTTFLADSSNIVLIMAIAFLVIELGRRILGDGTRSESLLYSITRLPRSVDLRYRTNRILVLCVIAIICIAYLVGETMAVSVNLGIAFFIAWALAREIAPDLEYPAFIGATLALQSAAVRGMPDIFLLFLLLLILRTICGTVSKTVTALDVGVLLGVVFLFGLQIVDRTLAIGIPPVHQLVGVGV